MLGDGIPWKSYALYHFWFYFSVDGMETDIPKTFIIKNITNQVFFCINH